MVDGERCAPRRWFAALGAFSAFTLCWVVIGLVGGGDFFAQGRAAIALLLLGLSIVGGVVLGARAIKRGARVAIIVLACGCLAFWFLVPDGWWALPPPTRNTVRVE